MHKPTVHILLATYNGAQFLTEQLDSIARQTYSAWTLTISDDGSTDNTLELIAAFAERITQPLKVLQGPRQKSSTLNFFHLIQNAPATETPDLYAFCDQDDVWLDNKLERAVEWHAQQQFHAVRLYCSRTQFVDEQLIPIGLSPGIQRPPSFGNALVQNIASGNTMVFSQDLLLAHKKVQPEHSVWHDWTTYLVATALCGKVWFDDEPSLLYRQHNGNVIGSNNGLKAQINRLKPLFQGRFKQWTDANISAVFDLEHSATCTAREIQINYVQLRAHKLPWKRITAWRRTEIRRQTLSSNFTLGIAIFFQLV